jgi:dTMP kinase
MFAPRDLLPQLRAFAGAIGVHVLMAALVVLGTINWQPFRERQPVGLTIEAVIVDTGEIRQQREEARRAQEMEERRQARNEELERQRQRELERKQEEERRQRQLEEQRKQDAQDRLQQLRMQRERKQEEERLRQERELEQIREQREAAERKRKLEEERLKQIEARKERERQEAAEAQRRAEAEAQQFRAGQMATLSDNYRAAVYTEDRPDSGRRGDLGGDRGQVQRGRGHAALDPGGGRAGRGASVPRLRGRVRARNRLHIHLRR